MSTKVRAQHTPRILIDHRDCGGGGCTGCANSGTKMARQLRPAGLSMPQDEQVFAAARELCPCYEGIKINAGVAQCTHADRRDDGEWCEQPSCPAIKATEHAA